MVEESQPGLVEALDQLIDPETRGDPMCPLRWTTKSTRVLADELTAQGYPAGLRSKYFRCSGWGVRDGWCVAVRLFGLSSRMPTPVSDYRQ